MSKLLATAPLSKSPAPRSKEPRTYYSGHEAARREIDEHAKDDPIYARIVEQYREELRARSNGSTMTGYRVGLNLSAS